MTKSSALRAARAAERAAERAAFAEEVAERAYQLRVRRAAEALIAGEGWAPPDYEGTWADELDLVDEEIAWQVTDLLQPGMNAMLVAEAKAGKTTLLLNLMRALADKEALFDRFEVRPLADGKRVGWWNAELSEGMARRWAREMNVANTDSLISLHLRGKQLPLEAPHVRRWAIKWLRENDVAVWILDPLGALCPVEEKDNTGMRAWLRALDEIKAAAGVETMVIAHHTGHAEAGSDIDTRVARARGASALKDWPDVTWTYYRGSKVTSRYLSALGRDVDVDEFELSYLAGDRRLLWASGNSRRDSKLLDMAKEAALALIAYWETKQEPLSQNGFVELKWTGDKNKRPAAIKKAVELGWVKTEPGKGGAILHSPGKSPNQRSMSVATEGEQ